MLPLFEMLMKANGGDAVNQMARQFGLNAEQVQSAWVNDFRHPGTLIPAQDAAFLRTDAVRTPMASNLVAVPRSAGDSLRAALGGTLFDWAQILAEARAPA